MRLFSSLVILSLMLAGGSNIYMAYSTFELSEHSGNLALARSGTASICINNPPIINISACNNTVRQNIAYSCSVTATDLDVGDTLTFSSVFISGTEFFVIESWGLISFTANQSSVGNHQVNISVSDNTGCGYDNAIFNIEVTDFNDPPYLSTVIPDQEFTQGSSLQLFLEDFFTDPDGDPMTFTSTIPPTISISIVGELVTITSGSCGFSENVRFFAEDPYNATGQSNIVSFTVNCPQTETEQTPSDDGGGGGGGSNSQECTPQYICGSWSDCMPTGRQRQKCVDVMDCYNVIEEFFYRECTYIAHCYNDIQDYDEEDIDCGGDDCKVCPTCDDGVQNGAETGIDCGGSCTACEHCFNGITDFDEEGLDCGGDECIPCPTCEDGILNGDETGIDCGGSCSACTVIQQPEPLKPMWPAYAGGVFIILLILLLTYRFYRHQLKRLLGKLRLLLVGKIDKILLLNDRDAENIVRELAALMEKYRTSKKLTQSIIFDFVKISREYYVRAFKVKTTITSDELLPIIKKKNLPKDLSSILESFFDRIESIEKGERIIHHEEFEQMAEELKEIIFLTSKYHRAKGVTFKRENIHDLVGEEKVYALIHNALFALEFGEDSEAFTLYMKAVKAYDELLMVEKQHVYGDLIRLYKEILYAKKITG